MSPARQSKRRFPPPGGAKAGSRRATRRDATAGEPLFVFSRENIRALDAAAVSELAIPSILLMEHASLALARHAVEMTPDGAGVLIVCGRGNNAGDGLALARHLHVREGPVSVLLADESALRGDAATNLEMVRRLGVPRTGLDGRGAREAFRAALDALPELGLVVDAVLGTGVSGPPRGDLLDLIHAMNEREEADVPVLAVDIPSGLDADTGEPAGAEGEAVRADRTVTFVGLKKGFLSIEAQRFLGDVYVEQIGTPMSLSKRLGERLEAVERRGAESGSPRPLKPRRPGDGGGNGGSEGGGSGGGGGGGKRDMVRGRSPG